MTVHNFLQPRTSVSLSENGDNDGSFSAANVALKVKDLLPGPEKELSIRDGYRQRWSEKGRLQMGMAVAVVPGLLVAIVAAGRDEFIENRRHVRAQTWFKFNRANRGGATHIEYVRDPRPNAGMGDSRGYVIGEVMHIPVASRID